MSAGAEVEEIKMTLPGARLDSRVTIRVFQWEVPLEMHNERWDIVISVGETLVFSLSGLREKPFYYEKS